MIWLMVAAGLTFLLWDVRQGRELRRKIPFALAEGEAYGLEILRRTGSKCQRWLYISLSTLEDEGFIESKTDGIEPEVCGGRQRRIYWLSDTGREYVEAMKGPK